MEVNLCCGAGCCGVIIHKDNANKIFDSNAFHVHFSVQLTDCVTLPDDRNWWPFSLSCEDTEEEKEDYLITCPRGKGPASTYVVKCLFCSAALELLRSSWRRILIIHHIYRRRMPMDWMDGELARVKSQTIKSYLINGSDDDRSTLWHTVTLTGINTTYRFIQFWRHSAANLYGMCNARDWFIVASSPGDDGMSKYR